MRTTLLILTMLCFGCDQSDRSERTMGATTSAADAPRGGDERLIVVDAAHAVRESQLYGKPYLLGAGTQIKLDGARFNFQDPDHRGRMANAVQVLYDRSEYLADWPIGKARGFVLLDGTSLKVLSGAPFTNFASGKQAFVAVGYRSPTSGVSDKNAFDPFWVGLVIFH